MKKIIAIVLIILAAGAGGFFAWQNMNRPKPVVPFTHDPGDYFVTDIRESSQLLKTDIMILMKDEAKKTEIEENNHRIRNVIIFILRNKTVEDLRTAGIELKLNQEITKKLCAEFKNEDFLQIYFNEFVIQ